MLRTVQVLLAEDEDVRATVLAFRNACAAVSETAFNQGKPLTNIELQRVAYKKIKTFLDSAQMACSVTRRVAGSYKTAKSNKRPAKKPFAFSRLFAIWLIGERGRDARVCDDGTLSIWTVNGRKRVAFTIPERASSTKPSDHQLRKDFDAAIEYNALQITERHGKLVATLAITLPDIATVGTSPVGVDLGETNAFVAVDAKDRELFISGKATKVRSTRTRKTRSSLQKKLATLKAQKRSTKSVGRVLKRLSRKNRNRTVDFARCSAKKLCEWASKDAVIVLEDLKIPRATKASKPGKSPKKKALRRRLSSLAYGIYRAAIESRAERVGIAVVAVNPAYTSQNCSRCPARGTRVKHQFSCAVCAHKEHADVNAARNIRDLYGAARSRGLSSASPEASSRGKPRASARGR